MTGVLRRRSGGTTPTLVTTDARWRRRQVFGALGLRHSLFQGTEAEARLLRQHAAGARLIVELGVAEGGSAVQLRSVMAHDGCLYLVDPYEPGRAGISLARIIARRAVGASANGRAVWLRQRSDQAARDWTGTIDFLHIDADHEFDRASRDWADWHVHVPVGGTVAFHDSAVFPGGWPTPEWGPVRIVESILAERSDWRLAARADSMSLLRRTA